MNQIKNTLIELVFFHDMEMEDVNCGSSFFLHTICGHTHGEGRGSPLFVRKALERVVRYLCIGNMATFYYL